ncbi:tetratricopeptide repeat protein [Flavihumibacter stibioxidans]|uniref:histidine kinase n=1 Tax=Flavihumibacter stibioxidans TaxID=1834163 RepID=A0ABR7M8D2_9BACT|nr:tetratricopeptide repeat-containing sensor histidine kinase [Flavihumibacter stibioxidans]MBC6490794.1 hypothetical protein [Flavihumibacter stibioxidans]
MKYILIIAFAFCQVSVSIAQKPDTNYLKSLYDHSLEFSEEKLDSLLINAAFIEQQSDQLDFRKGRILALRLKGIHSEFSGDYDEAIRYYLATLAESRSSGQIEYEIAALSDLAIVYSEIKQPAKAKEVYLRSLRLSELQGEVSSLISAYSNLGALYNMLNQTDTALIYLNRALKLSNQYKRTESLPVIYNNLGNVYFKENNFQKAREYFNINKQVHESSSDTASLWTDYLNLGDVFLEQGHYDSAKWYTDAALQVALRLGSKSKEAETYALISKFHEKQGQYRRAFEYQRKWYRLDTAMVNESSGRTIAEMQERFNARDREKQNRLLEASVEKGRLQNRNLKLLVIAAGIIGLLVGILLLVYRNSNLRLKKVNDIIGRQKEKLAILNQEKNSLISIVSHDLSTPFITIDTWSRLLEQDQPLSAGQQKSLEKIRGAALNGEKLIRQILEIERLGTSLEKLEMEELNLGDFAAHVAGEHQAAAAAKDIRLHVTLMKEPVFLMTDQALIRRILDNLLSNAIKFTPAGREVRVSVTDKGDFAELAVEDEGPGIPEEEQQLLFTKYAQLTNRPTAGEGSTGLGLAIVNRLVTELNGSITCTSETGKGCRFTVRFKK